MATKYFLGTADAVVQVDTCQIIGYTAGTTYTLTVGGYTVTASGDGSVNATATALAAAWNASTHAYFTAVTATAATDTVTLTANTPGVEFVATSSVSGGAGTIGAVTNSTANGGPNVWDDGDNWWDADADSVGIAPVNGDDVVIQDTNVNICWGLAQSAVTLDSLEIRKTYTGKLGLNYREFATSADGDTTVTAEIEYRARYLNIKVDYAQGMVLLGGHNGLGNPLGSQRIMLDLDNQKADVIVLGTAQSSADSGRPAVRLLANVNSTVIEIRSAPGGVGIADEEPGEISSINTLTVSATDATTRVVTGTGLTILAWTQTGGNNVLRRTTGAMTAVNVLGGILVTESVFGVTTATIEEGVLVANHTNGGSNAFTTLNVNGGTVDGLQSRDTRNWSTVNLKRGGTLKSDSGVINIANLIEPDVPFTLTVM